MDSLRTALSYVVGPLLIDLPDRDVMVCGTCFIVAAMGEYAIGVTATHAVQYATAQDTPSRVAPHPSSVFQFDETRKEWRKVKIITHVKHDDVPPFMSYALEAAQGYSRSDVDVCFLLLKAEEQPTLEIRRRIGLLSEPPSVGDKVLVVGYFDSEAKASHKIAVGGGAAFIAVNAKFQCVEASVTDVYHDGVRHLKFPCFQVSTPFYSGMSGGCVLKEKDGQWLACGVVCSDFNFGDDASGEHALAAQLWPALFTSLGETRKYAYHDENGGLVERDVKVIYDFVDAGAITDLSDALQHVSRSDQVASKFPLRWV
ncbi:trypsin-like peptidase domain-containing protein [uncultured Methylobacterium sp.]|uniref:trypsin-like peptidase domain-containing protein n=1 Tax=uncultured Methylobacterium sp. TaxID=157278 RepID=UPI0035CB972E